MAKSVHKNKKDRAHIGDTFGLLTLVRRVRKPKGQYGDSWQVKCSCGTVTVIREQYLFRSKNPKVDCGCSRTSILTQFKREYGIWKMVTRRCYFPTHASYKYYGGAGIKVHPAWIDGGRAVPLAQNIKAFTSFLNHVGPAPSPAHTLDRRNPFKDYTYGNVRWATRDQQARNKRIHWIAKRKWREAPSEQ